MLFPLGVGPGEGKVRRSRVEIAEEGFLGRREPAVRLLEHLVVPARQTELFARGASGQGWDVLRAEVGREAGEARNRVAAERLAVGRLDEVGVIAFLARMMAEEGETALFHAAAKVGRIGQR